MLRGKIATALFLLSFINLAFAQKVNIDSSIQESSEVESEKLNAVSADVVVSPSPIKQEENLAVAVLKNQAELPIRMAFDLKAFDGIENVIQNFSQLVCKNTFSSPLDLSCYKCSYKQTDALWEMNFHRKAVGDQSCSLAIVRIKSKNKTKFASLQNDFVDGAEEKFKVDFSKNGSRLIAGTKEEDFQVFTSREFNNAKNTFEEQLNLQLQFIYSLANQQKIDNAIDLMNNAFSGLPEKAFSEFIDFYFSEDSREKRKSWSEFILSLNKKSEKLQTKESGKLINQQVDFLRSMAFHKNMKKDFVNPACYDSLLKSVLPLRLSKATIDEFKNYSFLKITPPSEATLETSGGKVSTTIPSADSDAVASKVSASNQKQTSEKADESSTSPVNQPKYLIEFISDKSEKKKNLACDHLDSLVVRISSLSDELSCDDRAKEIEFYERKYKSFFKGEERPEFKLYQAFLAAHLMRLHESIYFSDLMELQNITDHARPSESDIKELSQKIDLSITKVSEYQEELESLLPYLGQSLKSRRDWLLKGVKSPRVFKICN